MTWAFRRIPSNTATATLRRVVFQLVDATDLITPEDITVTGVKVALTTDGASFVNSTNDIVKINGATGDYYLELTQTEINLTAGVKLWGRLQPTGCARTNLAVEIIQSNAFSNIADVVWDEVLTGATHNVTNSAGRRLRQVRSSLYSGVAQAGASLSITLDTGASATNNIYVGEIISIISGTGAGQTRSIVEYNGTTKVAQVEREWIVNPDATSNFEIVGSDELLIINEGKAQAAASATITLATTAVATDDVYNGSSVVISGGTGKGQARLITDYVGSTRVANVSPAWAVTPDTTSVYQILPVGQVIVQAFSGTAETDIDGIATKTSQLTFTEPGHVDANTRYVNDIELQGDGTAGNSWRPV